MNKGLSFIFKYLTIIKSYRVIEETVNNPNTINNNVYIIGKFLITVMVSTKSIALASLTIP